MGWDPLPKDSSEAIPLYLDLIIVFIAHSNMTQN